MDNIYKYVSNICYKNKYSPFFLMTPSHLIYSNSTGGHSQLSNQTSCFLPHIIWWHNPCTYGIIPIYICDFQTNLCFVPVRYEEDYQFHHSHIKSYHSAFNVAYYTAGSFYTHVKAYKNSVRLIIQPLVSSKFFDTSCSDSSVFTSIF